MYDLRLAQPSKKTRLFLRLYIYRPQRAAALHADSSEILIVIVTSYSSTWYGKQGQSYTKLVVSCWLLFWLMGRYVYLPQQVLLFEVIKSIGRIRCC